MPTRERIEPERNDQGRPELFNWSAVSDGNWWRLVKGDDFDTENDRARLQVAAYAAARRRGASAETRKQANGDLLVRFALKGGE